MSETKPELNMHPKSLQSKLSLGFFEHKSTHHADGSTSAGARAETSQQNSWPKFNPRPSKGLATILLIGPGAHLFNSVFFSCQDTLYS